MKIGIDIDGVLTDIEKYICDYGTKFCYENNIPINIEHIYYDERKLFQSVNISGKKGDVYNLSYWVKSLGLQEEGTGGDTYTRLCYSRANSIYEEEGLHLGCNLYGEWYNLNNFNIGKIAAGGFYGYTGSIPIIKTIENNEDGTITWTYSNLQIRNGIIIGAWL